jgi:hypothetical protein
MIPDSELYTDMTGTCIATRLTQTRRTALRLWSAGLLFIAGAGANAQVSPFVDTFSGLVLNPEGTAFRLNEEGPPPWPDTDYCAAMSQEIQGRKHGFLTGNLVHYIGGKYAVWNLQEHETLGLTHPFHHDLRSRGYGIVSNATTGVGHDLQGWEFYRDTRIAYGTVLIGATEYANPVPTRMYWRPDRMICE